MKRVTSLQLLLPLLTLVGISLGGCSRQSTVTQGAMKETYLHEYGVPISRSEWDGDGQSGSVVAILGDGAKVIKSYHNGILHGETTYTFPHSDRIARSETYKSGSLVREVWNYSSGMPKREERVSEAESTFITTWYESGIPKSIEEHRGSALISGSYHTPSNDTESNITQGRGTRIDRDGWGQIISKGEYEDGDLISVTTFYPNGTPNEIASYNNGLVSGKKQTFYPNGEPNTLEEWRNGVQDGITTIFENGEKTAEIPFVKGKRHGTEHRYRDGEKIAEEITWLNDNRHGPSSKYLDNTKHTQYYHRGKQVTEATYNELNSHLS